MVPGDGVLKGFRNGRIFMIFVRMVKSDKIEKTNEKTSVGFGRTEVSFRLYCTVVCILSSWHGPRNP